MPEIDYIKKVLRLAGKIKKDDGKPFAALIVRNGKIIASGVNNTRASNDPTAHAEILAIRKACQKLKTNRLEGATIYCSCEPCPMCLGAIYLARIDRIIYSVSSDDAAKFNFSDKFITEDIALPKEKRRLTYKQIFLDEAVKVLEKWHQNV